MSELNYNLGPAIATARQSIGDLQAAAEVVRADGVGVPSAVSAAISSARSAIAKVISTANKAANHTNADVTPPTPSPAAWPPAPAPTTPRRLRPAPVPPELTTAP